MRRIVILVLGALFLACGSIAQADWYGPLTLCTGVVSPRDGEVCADTGTHTIKMYLSSSATWTTVDVGFCTGTSASIAAATTDFIACGENPGVAAITAEANSQTMVPKGCTVSNLQVTLTTAANANLPVITVDKNTTGTSLTCTVDNVAPDTTTHCEDTTHSFTTTGATGAKDLLSIKLANPASANATGVVYVAFQINC